MVRASEGLAALNAIEELVNDLGRPRNDLWETAVWEDILTVELYFCNQVDNQAIVIPKTSTRSVPLLGWRLVLRPSSSLRVARGGTLAS